MFLIGFVKFINVKHFVVLITLLLTGVISEDLDVSSLSIYYDINSHAPLRISAIENSFSSEMMADDQFSTKTRDLTRRVAYRSNGCTCQDLTCGCCAGLNLQQFNFNREGCMNFTYDPLEFSIDATMFINNEAIFSNRISAKNPPALCIPVPIPYLPASVDFCAKVFDVYTPGQNLHMCLDFETRIQRSPVLVLHFDCMRMGNDGIALLKPGDPSTITSTTGSQLGSDIFDEVTEIKY